MRVRKVRQTTNDNVHFCLSDPDEHIGCPWLWPYICIYTVMWDIVFKGEDCKSIHHVQHLAELKHIISCMSQKISVLCITVHKSSLLEVDCVRVVFQKPELISKDDQTNIRRYLAAPVLAWHCQDAWHTRNSNKHDTFPVNPSVSCDIILYKSLPFENWIEGWLHQCYGVCALLKIFLFTDNLHLNLIKYSTSSTGSRLSQSCHLIAILAI